VSSLNNKKIERLSVTRQTIEQSRKPTAIDLFSGCGGLTQGLRDAGFEVIGAVEIDPLAAETYALNHKNVLLYNKDIRLVTTGDLLQACGLRSGELDLLAGCPPCQGFSRLRNNNKRCRLDDPRNRLIDDVGRFVRELLPKVVMLENVPALAQYTRYRDFKRQLRGLGYKISDQVLNVADFGIPQRRQRLVVLASRIGRIDHPSPAETHRTVRDAIGNLRAVGESNDPLHDLVEYRTARVKALIQAIPKNGGSRTALSSDFSLECHKNSNGFYDVYGRMSWDDVAPTITSGCINPSKGRFLHPEANRAITLREAALLQTFPTEYVFPLTRGKYAVAEMIGNALPPEFSRVQATAIRQHLIATAINS
jgi:DNA (cytosine-5)-methyltransferase 1